LCLTVTKIRSEDKNLFDTRIKVVTYRAQLQKLKRIVKGMFYWMITWALKFMIMKKT